MAMKKSNVERNISIFRDYFEMKNFAEVGEKYNLTAPSASNAFYGVFDAILRMVKRDELPLPVSQYRSDALREKKYWLDMLNVYEAYLAEEANVTIDSPVRKLGFNGITCDLLNRKGVVTVNDLLEAFRKNEVHLLSQRYERASKTKLFKTKLELHGFKVEGE